MSLWIAVPIWIIDAFVIVSSVQIIRRCIPETRRLKAQIRGVEAEIAAIEARR